MDVLAVVGVLVAIGIVVFRIARRPVIARTVTGRAWAIDGDTIIVNPRGRRVRVRLHGIDAPELDQPGGQTAKWYLVKLPRGRRVVCRLNGERSYDRHVGNVYLDGRDVGEMMVTAGQARDWPHFSGGRYRDAEQAAKRARYRRWR